MLFLQASSLYDPVAIHQRLEPHQKVLSLEVAIVEGKVCSNIVSNACRI